jgi:hypothetical protein
VKTISRTILALLLVAVIGLAAGCAPRIVGTKELPLGNDMATQIKDGATSYKVGVPTIALTGTGAYITDFSATVKVTNITNTRMIWGETTATVDRNGGEPYHLTVEFYLCEPLSQKADKYSDGTVAYGGTGYPKIIEGQTYAVSGIIQPHWQGVPLVYVPAAREFKQNSGSASFIEAPSGALQQDILSTPAAMQVASEFLSNMMTEQYTKSATYFAFPIREKELQDWRAAVMLHVNASHLTNFTVGQPEIHGYLQTYPVYVDKDGFRIDETVAIQTILPTAQESPEYAVIIKQYGAAMKRLDEAGGVPNKLDAKTLSYARKGKDLERQLYLTMAPKLMVTVVDSRSYIIIAMFAAKQAGAADWGVETRVITTPLGFRVDGFVPTILQR